MGVRDLLSLSATLRAGRVLRHSAIAPASSLHSLTTVSSLKEALELAAGQKVFISGGYGVYKEALPFVDVMYITEVQLMVEDGDVFFPDFDADDFEKTVGETAGDEIKYTRVIYTRKKQVKA